MRLAADLGVRRTRGAGETARDERYPDVDNSTCRVLSSTRSLRRGAGRELPGCRAHAPGSPAEISQRHGRCLPCVGTALLTAVPCRLVGWSDCWPVWWVRGC